MVSDKIVFGISCGDVNGVGIEIIIKAFLDGQFLHYGIPVLYAPLTVVNFYKKLFGYNQLSLNVIAKTQDAIQNKFNIINISDSEFIVEPGQANIISGKLALDSLDCAIGDLKQNLIDVLVTLPINKQTVALNQHNFVGHTEYLLQKLDLNSNCLMFLCSNKIKVATLTNHLPISKVAKNINYKILSEKIKILLESLKKDFSIPTPKVAILGLNPHAGDSGLIGSEEAKIILPIIREFFELGNLVYGPYSSDAFFGSGSYKSFDAVLGMYHDQSLIPFKFLSFGGGINFTAGLPVIRVSPDHGVAYDIAGLGKADPNSLIESIALAKKIYYNRLSCS